MRELLKRGASKQAQKTPKTTTARVLAQTEQPRKMQLPVATQPTEGGSNPSPGRQQMSGQSVRAASVNNQPIDTLTITIVQQIMTVPWCCVRTRQIIGHNKNCHKPLNQNGQ
jgi:hypothetical protein